MPIQNYDAGPFNDDHPDGPFGHYPDDRGLMGSLSWFRQLYSTCIV